MTLKSKISILYHHPVIIKDIIRAKSLDDIRAKIIKLKEKQTKLQNEKEVSNFINNIKENTSFHIDSNYNPMLNRLCYIEDWDHNELKNIINGLQNPIFESFIHRKDWEWALGIIAMKRFNKLNDKCTAIGIGAGREEVLFYLANHLKHVYATDIYDQKNGIM